MMKSNQSLLRLAAVALVGLTAASGANAQNITRLISTTTGAIPNLVDLTAPALNNSGVVAFTAAETAFRDPYVYKVDSGGGVTRVASPIAFGPTPQFGRVAVNDGGLVAYTTTRPLNVLFSIPGVATAFSENQGYNLIQEASESLGNVSVNNAGQVGYDFFSRVGLGYTTAIRRATSSADIVNVATGDVTVSQSGFANGDAVGAGTLNNAGTMSYLRNGPNFPPGSVTRIDAGGNAQTFGVPAGSNGFNSGVTGINDAGTLLVGTENQVGTINAAGNYSLLANAAGGFSDFNGGSLNNRGDVAFTALRGGARGLYLALGGESPTGVLQVGQSLFGSTLTELELHRDGLNDVGQVAVRYALQSGERGVAVFSTAAPEPGTVALLGLALPVWAVARRRRG